MSELASFIQNVPRTVPEGWCLNCKICCRFPDTAGVQTPTWSPLEADWAISSQGAQNWFRPIPDSPAWTPRLSSCGNGYRCPAFHAQSNRCSIYPVRPLDCRLYPFGMTKNSGGTEVLLTMDTKCPYIQAHGTDPEALDSAAVLARYLESPAALNYLKTNPRIIGDFWPEFLSMAALPGMTAMLQQETNDPHPLPPALKSLTWDVLPLLEEALSLEGHVYSGYTVPSLLGWSDLIHYGWAYLEGALCIFAQQGGGIFMPLPPLGKKVRPEAFRAAWRILSEANQGSRVSRIEGIEAPTLRQLDTKAFQLREWLRLDEAAPLVISESANPEYLYRRADLVALKGNRYRSQRGSINRFSRKTPHFQVRPFQGRDLASCLQLYTLWGIHRQQADSSPFVKALVRDGLFFHRRLMMDCQRLGLTGRVLEIDGKIRGYTFGAPASPRVFCVFLEIADPAFPGGNQVLFREFCREMETYLFINAMGDDGLPGLRRAKQACRPVGMVKTFILELTGVEPATS